MTEFNEDADINAVFQQLTQGLEIPSFVAEELPVIPRDGDPIRINSLLGEAVRQELLAAYASSRLEAKDGRLNATEMRQVLREGPLGYGDMVAVGGSGVVQCFSHDQSSMGIAIMTGGLHLFGTIHDVTLSGYYAAERSHLQAVLDEEAQLSLEQKIGGLVILKNAIFCKVDGYGQAVERYDRVMYPIHCEAMPMSAAYPG